MAIDNFGGLTSEEKINEVLKLDTMNVKTINGYGFITDFAVEREKISKYIKPRIYPVFKIRDHNSTSDGYWYELSEIIKIGDKKVEEFFH